jgi:hypothetical protein
MRTTIVTSNLIADLTCSTTALCRDRRQSTMAGTSACRPAGACDTLLLLAALSLTLVSRLSSASASDTRCRRTASAHSDSAIAANKYCARCYGDTQQQRNTTHLMCVGYSSRRDRLFANKITSHATTPSPLHPNLFARVERHQVVGVGVVARRAAAL